MYRKLFVNTAFPLVIYMMVWLALAAWLGVETTTTTARAASDSATEGSLQAIDASGKAAGFCPLKHTDVKAEISGFLSRVTVRQEFLNPFKEKIEAVYTFPLPQRAAVDDMTMEVGGRTVRGRILRREEAQAAYEAARLNGQVASLLDQERPNIFTQSVANIMPGERVTVVISYVERLKYEDGSYEFVFPMVVGPRYIPGTPTAQQRQGGGTSPDTTRVADASRITPPVAPQGTRAGHDISIEVSLDAGVPINEINSISHAIDTERRGSQSATVRLRKVSVIPNKDFILRYDVAGRRVEDAVLTHRTDKEGFFTLILQPPDAVAAPDVMPKELVFVLDTSGSMEGFPIEKAKETMKLALDGLYPQDTFNLITFAGDTHILFPKPVPATKANLAKAQAFLASRNGDGGTEMMKAVRAALAPSDAPQDHVRIVCFMTDGYVGDDEAIISEVQKHSDARVFSFGIGSSVNRFLLDKMAEYGRGEVEYVTLNDDGSAAARRFHERVRNPLLTDISVDWAGLPVADVYPKRIPDLFSAKPVVLTGRYTGVGRASVRLKGKMAGRDFEREIAVELPEVAPQHDTLAKLWARTRIDDLMKEDNKELQHGATHDSLRETITQLGLEYRLMTPYTSFVAVEEMIVTDNGQPRRIDVPVETPEGVSGEAIGQADGSGSAYAGKGTFTSTPVSSCGTCAMVNVTDVAQIDQSSTAVTTIITEDQINPGRNSPNGIRLRLPKKSKSGSGAGDAGVDGRTKDKQASAEAVEKEKRQTMLAKLHPSIAAVVERLKKKEAQPAPEEAKFVRESKAEIQVWLVDKSPETIEQLKQLGFEVLLDPKTTKLVIGRIALDKLEALAELKQVRYLAPQVMTK
ncbi:MAG TPA: VIT domain-containing protein [Pyrinomonadaceae bacterium]|jgi:Ca-activated chloride channel family protein